MASERLETKLRRYVDAKRKKEQTAQAETEAAAAFKTEEAALYDELEEELGKVKTITIDLGEGYGEYRFTRQSQVYHKIWNEDKLHESLDNEALSDEMVKVKFNGSGLNQLVQSRVKNGQKLPEGLTTRLTRWVTASKVNK